MDYYYLILDYLESNGFLDEAHPVNDFLKEQMKDKENDEGELQKISRAAEKLKGDEMIGYTSMPILGRNGENLDNNTLLITLIKKGEQYIREQRRLNSEHGLLRRQTQSIEESNAQNILTGQSVVASNNQTRWFNNATLWLSGATLLTLGVYTFFTSKSITGEEFLQLKTTIENNTKILDSMLQSQRGIDTSLRKIYHVDSSLKK